MFIESTISKLMGSWWINSRKITSILYMHIELPSFDVFQNQ